MGIFIIFFFHLFTYSLSLILSKNSSSCHIVIPRDNALVYLLPGFSPTITTPVFALTLPDTLPPKFSIIVLASSLVMLVSVPVNTKVFPANLSSSFLY